MPPDNPYKAKRLGYQINGFDMSRWKSKGYSLCLDGIKQIVLGSLYRSPNTDVKQLFNHLEETIPQVKQENGSKELVLGMDHNLDLLKSHLHTQTQKFLDMLLELNMLPTITRPSRIAQQSATLIDNIFVSERLHHNLIPA